MEAKRWQQIEFLYYQALKLAAAEREAFLLRACAEDKSLLAEMQTLMLAHEKNNSFLEKPALNDAAEMLSTRPNELACGRQLGVYKVSTLLGAGGMGEVYLAEDMRLGRKVALKILLPGLVHNPLLVHRFQQEARATSALNHPNILTVYEVGQDSSGIHFIAAEYVEGETLRQILSSRREIKLEEIVDIALQTAFALAAAHETGVIHRDVKPQNIMVRADGYVKVLDFGIAKLIDNRFLTQKSNSPLSTDTGVILGTAIYMSPEQARGLKVNSQTDLWSFGVTLYEMVTKQVPFAGATTSDVIVSILEREPLDLAEIVTNLPPKLEQIIKRCLCKDVSARYHSAAEIIEDLQALQKQIQVSGGGSISLARRPLKNRITAENNQTTDDGDASRAERQKYPTGVSRSKIRLLEHFLNWKRLYLAASAVLLSFIIGTVLTDSGKRINWLKLPFSSNNSALSFQQAQINRLTNSGNVILSNISPDGKYLAYVVFESGQQSLWLRQIAAPPARMILASTGDLYRGLSFSPDGNFIYYVTHEKAKGMGVLYAVPIFGGEPRRIRENIEAPVAFSPNGKSFAFLRATNDGGAAGHALIIANPDGTEIKTLAVHREPDLFSRDGFAWSADGQSIIIASTKTADTSLKSMQLVEIQVADGSERVFSSHQWKEIGRVSSLKNGDVIMTATEQSANSAQIYQISYPNGEIQSITNDLNGYRSVSTSSDSKIIAAVQSERTSHIWTASTDNLDQMKRITPGVGSYYQTSWTPDDKIIYVSEESGNKDIWTMEADGSNPKELTFDPATDSYPKATPDGRYIVFISNRGGMFKLWRMDRDGGNLKLLNNEEVDNSDYSLDNNFVYYTAPMSKKWFLSKVSIEGGITTRLLDFPSMRGVVSPDGKLIACRFLDEKTNSKWDIGIASVADKNIIKALDIPTDLPIQVFRWTADGKSLTFLNTRDDIYNLWSVKARGGQPEQLSHFNSSDQILHYDWSANGKKLVCLRGQRISDVILLTASLK